MIRCILIDDELTARNILKKYISSVSYLHFSGEFKNAVDALSFVEKNPIDLIFLDIEMPLVSGIDFANIVDKDTDIIFTTAHREFAVEGFELNAVDYLLKPFSFNRFLKAIKRCLKNDALPYDTLPSEYMYIKTNKKMVKIRYSDLLFIEGMGNYIKIHLVAKTIITYENMASILESLPKGAFVRIHKSYIINISKLDTYTKDYVEIEKKYLRIGPTYRNNFLNSLK